MFLQQIKKMASQSNQLVIIIKLISTVKIICGTTSLPGVRMSRGIPGLCDKFDKWQGGRRLPWEQKVTQVFGFQ